VKKPWYKSRTLWFNVASGATTALIAAVGPDSGVPATIALVVTALGNLVLRIISTAQLTK